MNELALFAGAGGGILGGVLLGWRTVCAVELDAFCARRLMQRQNEGHLPPFPVWDDVRTFDGRPWRGVIDVVSGGFPCTDISVAGRGAGIEGEASGLWSEMARIIGEVRPRFAFVENSPALVVRGLGRVLGDLAALGYDCRWDVLAAAHVGAPHRRERLWIVGHSHRAGLEERPSQPSDDGQKQPAPVGTGWWDAEPSLGRMAHGVAHRVDRLRAIGNGQVPRVAATAWQLLARVNACFTGASLRSVRRGSGVSRPLLEDKMKIEMQSTSKIVNLSGVPARIWEGTTVGPHPVRVVVYVTRLSIDPEGDALTAEQCDSFNADLEEHESPRPEIEAIPLRLIL